MAFATLMAISRWDRFKIHIGAFLASLLIRCIGVTCKVVVEQGREILDELIENPRPVIISFWHNTIFYMVYYLGHEVIRKGKVPLTVLISQSKDGELIARTAARFGASAARGSTTRGGRAALQVLLKTLNKEKQSVVTTPDGPLGPVYSFQMGTTVLSRMSGAAVIPVGYSVDRAWVFNSWDGFVIPKPFARVSIGIGPMHTVPREARTEEELEEQRKILEENMMSMIRGTEESVRDASDGELSSPREARKVQASLAQRRE